MICMSYSAWVVNPVMVLPLIMDSPVVGSMTPGYIASPWQLFIKQMLIFLGLHSLLQYGFLWGGVTGGKARKRGWQ